MQVPVTKIFEKSLLAKTRYVFNEGGTRSSKTYSVMQVLYYIAANAQQPTIISICSETMPHLRKGVMRDFFGFLESNGLYRPGQHNKSESTYKVGNCLIEFFSTDSVSKVHGPGRDYLFINELQNIPYEIFFHLVQRTTKQVFADWNPTHEFYIHKDYLNNPVYSSDITYIHSTLFDNPFLSEEIKKDVLRRADRDENYKRVYVEGKVGALEGLVYPNFELIDRMPDGNYIYGMDFGFTNDPTTTIQVLRTGEAIYLNELLYEKGLSNANIAAYLNTFKVAKHYDEIHADSSEPKSISEIFNFGYNIKGAVKGSDSINAGVQFINQHKIFVTKTSTNLIKELRNYRYQTDKNGQLINKPIDMYNHCLDAVRYAVSKYLPITKTNEFVVPLTRNYKNF